jgi:flagellar hook protein FlgE
MLNSLYSGVSGMKGFQTKLDLIGNNVANVSTVGFKKSRVMFQDIMSKNVGGANAPTNQNGGVNPKQIGLGTRIGTIDTLHTPGSPMTTNVGTDLAIDDGDAFFVVTPDAGSGENYLTKAGNFTRDANGDLVNSNGFFVLGVAVEIDPSAAPGTPGILHQIPINITTDGSSNLDASGAVTLDANNNEKIPLKFTSYSIDSNGYINVVREDGKIGKLAIGMDSTNLQTYEKYYLNDSASVTQDENISIATSVVTNPGGLNKVGNTMFEVTGNSGAADSGRIENNSGGSIISGVLEMSNVDLTEEFTEMIIAQRGFQANARTITTSDSILEEIVNLKR